MWKWRNLSFSFFTFTLFKKRANLRRIYEIFITLTLTLIKTGWKKRHILRNWRIWQGFIKGLAKKLNETTKEAYWQLAIFNKIANWRKWGIGQESIKGFAKPQMRWQRGKSWLMAIIRKRQVLGEKRQISAKMASMPKIPQGFCQIFK